MSDELEALILEGCKETFDKANIASLATIAELDAAQDCDEARASLLEPEIAELKSPADVAEKLTKEAESQFQ